MELSSVGLPRDPRFFQRLGERAGIHVVMGAGFYREGWLSPVARSMGADALTEVILCELNEGIDGTGLRRNYR